MEGLTINASMGTSTLVVVLITFDRFISVCQPYRYKAVHTKKYCYSGIIFSMIISICVWIPNCFLKVPAKDTECETFYYKRTQDLNTTYWVSCQVIDPKKHEWYIVYAWVREVIILFIPLLIIIVLNILILNKFVGRRKAYKLSVKAMEMQSSMSEVQSNAKKSNLEVTSNKKSNGSKNKEESKIKEIVNHQHALRAEKPKEDVEAGSKNKTKRKGKSKNYANGKNKVSDATEVKEENGLKNKKRKNIENKTKIKPLAELARSPTIRSQNSTEDQILINLLKAIIFSFIVTLLPAGIFNAAYTYKLSIGIQYEIFRAIANDLQLVNHASNFYLYILLSKSIRETIPAFMHNCLANLNIESCWDMSKYPNPKHDRNKKHNHRSQLQRTNLDFATSSKAYREGRRRSSDVSVMNLPFKNRQTRASTKSCPVFLERNRQENYV